MDWNTPPHRSSGPGAFRDLELLLDRLKGQLGFPFPGKIPIWGFLLFILVIFLAYNSYYTVEPEETAVVQRFGEFVRTTDAGLHFKMPFGIETVRKVRTGRVEQHEYGYRTAVAGVRSSFVEKGYEEQARMLSGDLNVVDLQWTVQYKVDDPIAYLFRLEDVESTIDDISESVVRRIVGNRFADEVFTVGRASIADMARTEMQQILNSYHTGIRIVTVQLQNANPPDPVKAAFNEVNEARQEKERMINEAQKVFNQQIPRASGEARQVISQAEAYGLERVNRAQGDSRRFLDILSEFQKSPEVSRQRMYLEAFQTFIGKLDRVVIVDEQQKNLLPMLDLNRLTEGTLPKVVEKAAGSDAPSGNPPGNGDKAR
jgi:modulator of FtsH protease HflK